MKYTKLFIMAGTAKMRKHIPIHDLCEKLTPATKTNILAYHAVLGCDVTSQPHGLSKVEENSDLLSSLGKVPLIPDAVTSVEKFVVKLFNLPKTGDMRRCVVCALWQKPKAPTHQQCP